MRKMTEFLMRNRRRLWTLSALFLLAGACLVMAACAVPVWLTDAEGLGTLLVTAAGSILAAVGALTGNIAVAGVGTLVTAWAEKVQAAIANVNALIESYKKSPGETELQAVEAAAQLAISDIQSFDAIVGVPAAVSAVIQKAAQLVLNELESLISLLPLAQSAPAAGSAVTVKFPSLKADFAAKFNAALSEPTGDEGVDAALATVKKL
jgi:hypothetical protein